jgi:hypothetical protein
VSTVEIVPLILAHEGDHVVIHLQSADNVFSWRMVARSAGADFPGSIVPASRLSPFELMALNQVPLPNTPVPHTSTGLLMVHGAIQPGTTFVIDAQNNTSLSVFAGYLPIPAPPKSGTTTVKLYIDGVAVASQDIPYRSPFP